ncbi:MAG: hypothetical protein RMK97_10325 [Sutterellaceae bacterium]|nr:hypothetical protein [Burkholderiaceae bacterium]MDW8430877.1 hypothetical protein [Sutterellaceae bacterium]
MPRIHFATSLRAIAAAVACCFAPPAGAFGLGAAELESHLGQPLVLRIPVFGDEADVLAPHCVRLLPQASSDIPTLGVGRVNLERGPAGSTLRISSLKPIQEPVLRIVLEVGCQTRLRREFVVLLDPPAGDSSAPTFEFGAPKILAMRGQPLLVHVPIAAGPALEPHCVRITRAEAVERPHVLSDLRATLLQEDGQRLLRLVTVDAVQDARVHVQVELGCDSPVRHAFVFALAPPHDAAAATPETTEAVPATARSPAPAQQRAAATAPPRHSRSRLAARPATAPSVAAASSAPLGMPVDRLIIAKPEVVLAPGRSAADEGAPELLRQLEALATEVRRLRAEVEATQIRSRALEAQRVGGGGLAWAAMLAAVLLFGVGILLGRRASPRREAAGEAAGPWTRIMGTARRHDAADKATASAPAVYAAVAEPPTHGPQSSAIQVTELGATTQTIGELYRSLIATPTQAAPPTKAEIALDLELGTARTTLMAPQTRTEIAVDIDLSERKAEHAKPQPVPSEPGTSELPAMDTPTQATTVPLTRALELNLDLSVPAHAAPPPKTDG